jgi:hypothetical protein
MPEEIRYTSTKFAEEVLKESFRSKVHETPVANVLAVVIKKLLFGTWWFDCNWKEELMVQLFRMPVQAGLEDSSPSLKSSNTWAEQGKANAVITSKKYLYSLFISCKLEQTQKDSRGKTS